LNGYGRRATDAPAQATEVPVQGERRRGSDPTSSDPAPSDPAQFSPTQSDVPGSQPPLERRSDR
ncbi:MAG: hypothetical protein MI861_22635, partial [Pirellulales bacterium]|nr:hypothetical protein [Pirellulales bacterium]